MVFDALTVQEVLKRFVMAPTNYELLPSLLPIIGGALVIELYFGKHESESLGWNTSVGNAIIWVTTGISLLITSDLAQMERYASYFLAGVGSLVGYMNFYHKWSESVAFIISSAGIVYSLAYVTVVLVKTNIPVNNTVLKASLIFIIATNIGFKVIQMFETPAQDSFGMR